jgi:hypothetical protein
MKRGEMKFGSLAHYRGFEDGARGDPKDGTLHYAPPEGLEITMLKDDRKLTGTSFSSAAQNMFVYCVSNELSADCAKDFGPFCVEIADPEKLVTPVKARACCGSKLDYARTIFGRIEYRQLTRFQALIGRFRRKLSS